MDELIEGSLENIDWAATRQVINRTNVIEIVPDSRYLFIVRFDRLDNQMSTEQIKQQVEIVIRSLLGKECKFEIIITDGDVSIDCYRFEDSPLV